MNEHAKFSPSHASTWSNCTASHALEQKVGSQDHSSPAAEEGTYAHGILEKCLVMGGTPYDWLPEERPADFPESVEKYDRDEMAEGVQLAVDYVNSRCIELDLRVLVEQKVTLSEDCWGTADVIMYATDGRYVEPFDFKYGRGVMVEVDNNAQLRIYGSGALKKLKDEGIPVGDTTTVVTTIGQPRIKHPAGPIRSIWDYGDVFVEYGARYLRIIDDIKSGKVLFNPSEGACRWCRAKGSCKAFATHSITHMFGEVPMTTRDLEEKAIRDPDVLSMEERTAILRNVELCRAWLKAVEAQSLEMALEGKTIDGFKVVLGGNTQRKWTLGEEEMLKKLRGMGFKVAEATTQKVLGPAPIEKLAKRLKFSERKQKNLHEYIIKPQGKRTLVPESDRRAAVALTADAMFGKPEEK